MKPTQDQAFELGPDVIQLLLPHRRPLLMVDLVTRYGREPLPTLQASRQISANEEVFAGHFPEIHIWPGVYVIEGLGQSCNLLEVLVALQEGWASRGGTPDDVLAALRNLELGYRLQPGFRPDASDRLLEGLREMGPRMGFAAAVDLKFLLPVFPGHRLDYRVSRTHLNDNMARHEVEAEVDGRLVARGVMHGRIAVPVPVLPRHG